MFEVKSHGHKTTISNEGIIQGAFCIETGIGWDNIRKPIIEKLIWHLQDVLKILNKLERKKEAKKTQDKVYNTRKELKDAGILSKKKKEEKGIIWSSDYFFCGRLSGVILCLGVLLLLGGIK